MELLSHEMNKEKWLKAEKDLEQSFNAYLSDEEQIVRATFKSLLSTWTDIIFEGPIRRCESPIEKVMFLTLQHLRMFNLYDRHSSLDLKFFPQKEIDLGERKIRVDFLVILRQLKLSGMKDYYTPCWDILKEAHVVVECDGHDYHERTKEQAQRDRERDRLLQYHGYPIFRFTGSEIYKDPMGCTRQVIEFLMESIDVWYA